MRFPTIGGGGLPRTLVAAAASAAFVLAPISGAQDEAAEPDRSSLTITGRSWDELLLAVKTIAEAATPAAGDMIDGALVGMLGDVPDHTDTDAPIHVVMIMPQVMGQAPDLFFLVKPTNSKALRGAINDLPQAEGLGVAKFGEHVLFGPKDSKTAADMVEIAEGWTAPAGHDAPEHDVRITLQTNQIERQTAGAMARGLVGMAGGQMSAELGESGVGVEEMNLMMQTYGQIAELLIAGTDTLVLDINVTDEELRIVSVLDTAKDSALASAVAAPTKNGANLSKYLNHNQIFSVAYRLEDNEAMTATMDEMTKLVTTMSKMGGIDYADFPEVMEKIGRDSVPSIGGAGLSFEGGQMSGFALYELTGDQDVKAYYDAMISMVDEVDIGEESAYSSMKLERGVSKIEGLSIDRVTMELNTELFGDELGGQEMVDIMTSIYGEDGLVMDYAQSGNKIYYGIGENTVEKALKLGELDPSALPIEANENTYFIGTYNVLEYMRFVGQLMTKMMPPEMADFNPFAGIGPREDDEPVIGFRTDLTPGQIHGEIVLPLEVITTVSDSMQRAMMQNFEQEEIFIE